MVQLADNIESATSETTGITQQTLWLPRIVHIRADITGLDDATINFALLKSNPFVNFQLLLAQDCAVTQAWLTPFSALRIDQIYFLYAWSSVPKASPRVARLAGLSLAIATPGDDYKRWLTTFPMSQHGKLVVWCIEIDMRYDGGETGAMEIVLFEENMRMLEARSERSHCSGDHKSRHYNDSARFL